ncbi:hypothetical protein FNF27_06212 [Cafeteria roenbergensis]|uniref:Uncharacterized protein n=1 Tax=Cafeteria roenbergensis TaxID=33653 RepID=A0A5A8E2C0_CAFRO|nr:hypothetical protein FNF29_07209 [Cafeteria roenbergensis]KAA0151805.1 hypothetical protein FNF31_06756 [Cafeteria roenbergensis]KAA0152454.1 hypothetical protein FNF28_07041 [Cafeteria roenbergensis]KAA0171943.1 hypothetical protein FNF27_06212 [Cafeteria roenbergensis]|eukprot:KAA0147654.1 hypothetical protein FNF29_07209 [Cafeteria roenbergensis]
MEHARDALSVHWLALDAVGHRVRSLERRAQRATQVSESCLRSQRGELVSLVAKVQDQMRAVETDINAWLSTAGPAGLAKERHIEAGVAEIERRVDRAEATVRRADAALAYSVSGLGAASEGRGASRASVSALVDAAILGNAFASPSGGNGEARLAAIEARSEELALSSASRMLHGSEAHAAEKLASACRRAEAVAAGYRDSAMGHAGAARAASHNLHAQLEALEDAVHQARAAAARCSPAAASDGPAAAGGDSDGRLAEQAGRAAARADAAAVRARAVLSGQEGPFTGPADSQVGSASEAAEASRQRWLRVRMAAAAAEDSARMVLRG